MDKRGVVISLAATLALQSLAAMAAVTVPIFAPIAAKEIGTSPTYVGLYVALIYISSMIASLWSGYFILRYGGIRLSQIALAFCGLGLALTAGGNIPFFIMSAFILGLGYGPMTPASSHILFNNTPTRLLSFVFSLKQSGVPLGGAMAGAIVPSLVVVCGWEYSAIIVGIFCFLIAILVQPSRVRLDADRQSDYQISFQAVIQPLKMVLSRRSFLKLAVTSLIFSGMQLCLITYMVIYLIKSVGISLITAGLTLSAAQGVSIFARIFWGIIADRYIKPRLMLGLLGMMMSLAAIATGLFNSAWPYTAILTVSILFGATAIGWNGVYLAEVARLAPEGKAGVATAGTLLFTYLGVVVGPPIFGVLVAGMGSYSLAYVVFAILTFFWSIFLILSRNESAEHSFH